MYVLGVKACYSPVITTSGQIYAAAQIQVRYGQNNEEIAVAIFQGTGRSNCTFVRLKQLKRKKIASVIHQILVISVLGAR
jgi:hypothetical protein